MLIEGRSRLGIGRGIQARDSPKDRIVRIPKRLPTKPQRIGYHNLATNVVFQDNRTSFAFFEPVSTRRNLSQVES